MSGSTTAGLDTGSFGGGGKSYSGDMGTGVDGFGQALNTAMGQFADYNNAVTSSLPAGTTVTGGPGVDVQMGPSQTYAGGSPEAKALLNEIGYDPMADDSTQSGGGLFGTSFFGPSSGGKSSSGGGMNAVTGGLDPVPGERVLTGPNAVGQLFTTAMNDALAQQQGQTPIGAGLGGLVQQAQMNGGQAGAPGYAQVSLGTPAAASTTPGMARMQAQGQMARGGRNPLQGASPMNISASQIGPGGINNRATYGGQATNPNFQGGLRPAPSNYRPPRGGQTMLSPNTMGRGGYQPANAGMPVNAMPGRTATGQPTSLAMKQFNAQPQVASNRAQAVRNLGQRAEGNLLPMSMTGPTVAQGRFFNRY